MLANVITKIRLFPRDNCDVEFFFLLEVYLVINNYIVLRNFIDHTEIVRPVVVISKRSQYFIR